MTDKVQCSVCRKILGADLGIHRLADGVPVTVCLTAPCWEAYARIADTPQPRPPGLRPRVRDYADAGL